MKPRLHAIPALLPGLIIAQVIATVQIYLSNAQLYRTLEIIGDHSYLPIPNELVMPHLKEIAPALWGGLFFTLSLGAGLSLLSLAAAWAWVRFFRPSRSISALYALLWLGVLIAMNFRGVTPMASLYFLLIPPAVFITASRRFPPPEGRPAGYGRLMPVAAAVLLGLLWSPYMDRDFFGEFRDRLLLSNRFGQGINQFYYDYTLYAAEAFKSLNQKTLKTCNLKDAGSEPVARALERELEKYDYLNTGGDGVADLKVAQAGQAFILAHRGSPVMQATLQDLLSRAKAVLKEFSVKSDRLQFFRKVTFLSLLAALPVVLYLFFLDMFYFGCSFFMSEKNAATVAAFICFCMGAGLLAVFILNGGGVSAEAQVGRALQSEKSGDRVAALKIVEQKGLEIAGFANYERLLASPHLAERYWLVRTLGVSRKPRTYRDLLSFLDDFQINIVSMAYYALGRRGDRRAVPEILKQIKASRHWYSQWYAYRALKELGWRQSREKRGVRPVE